MKKRIISLSLVLALSVLSVPAFANELSIQQRKELDKQEISVNELTKEEIQLKKATVKVPESISSDISNYVKSEGEFWSVLSANLPTDTYGGMYVRDGILHVKAVGDGNIPRIKSKINQIENSIETTVKSEIDILLLEEVESKTNEEKLQMIENSFEDVAKYKNSETDLMIEDDMSELQESNSIIIIEKDATYTIDELENAIDKLWNADSEGEINLLGAGIYGSKNSLFVEAKEWDEEMKETVLNITGIDKEHLVFEISSGDCEDLASTDAIPGDVINGKFGTSATLGCGVYYEIEGLSDNGDGDYGFITAAHGFEEGEEMKIYGGILAGFIDFINLGPVNGNRYAYADVAVIYKAKDPNNNSRYPATYTMKTDGGKIILNTGRAIEGDTVVLLGKSSTKLTGEVLATDYTIKWNSSNYPEGNGTYKYMIKTNMPSLNGDSGGPLLRLSSDKSYYTLLGILKGRESEQAIFTSWKCIESYLEYGSKARQVNVWLWP